MSKIFIVALFGLSLCIKFSNAEIGNAFLKFQKDYDREYGTVEETLFRYNIFQENYKKIEEMNRQETDVVLAINQFADLTQEEFKATYLGYKPSRSPCTVKHTKTTPQEIIDWRKKGAVTTVKDQAQCGSCWAFSAVCALEGLNAIKTKKLTRYSEQELVDCASEYGDNHGCKGGDMCQAFDYVKDNGISLESEYPYKARTMACRKASASLKISGCVNVTRNDSLELLEALAIGPVSVGVRASNVKFMYYSRGIIKERCGKEKDELDHGITVVGAAVDDDNTPYWIVRNSWGASWGQYGHVYIMRSKTKGPGVCGIAMDASYPVA